MTGTQSASTGGSRGHPRLGIVAQVAGIAGVVVCAALIVALWMAQGWAADQVEQVHARLDQGVGRASTAVGLVAGRIDSVASDVSGISEAASSIALEPAAAERIQALTGRLSGVINGYREVSVRYGEVREQVMSAIGALETIDRFVPGIDVPQGPLDALKELDARIGEIDASVSSLAETASTIGSAGTVASTISERAGAVSQRLEDASSAVEGVGARLTELQGDLQGMADRLATYLLLGSVGGTLLLAYLVMLNAALWVLGRHWRREAGR